MLSFFVAQLQPKLVGDAARDSMMRHHQVRKLQRLLIAPDARSISRVDKLRINGEDLIAPADPPDHHGADAEFPADRAGVELAVFVSNHRAVGNNPQSRKLI